MNRFEQAFSDTESIAEVTAKSATDLAKLAKELRKAAKEGNIAAIKRTQEKLNAARMALEQAVANAVQSWPFQDHEEEQYLRDGYSAELRRAASERGLEIHERDGRLICHPSIVRILPGARAVKIDKKQTKAIRPSHLLGLLYENQKKPGRYPVDRFLGALYARYLDIILEDSSSRLVKGVQERVVPLDRIYKQFTSLPGTTLEYATTDFARDIYRLETSGQTTTRSGASVSFPASTGTRSAKGLFTFVGPDGQDVQYYGVRFTEAG